MLVGPESKQTLALRCARWSSGRLGDSGAATGPSNDLPSERLLPATRPEVSTIPGKPLLPRRRVRSSECRSFCGHCPTKAQIQHSRRYADAVGLRRLRGQDECDKPRCPTVSGVQMKRNPPGAPRIARRVASRVQDRWPRGSECAKRENDVADQPSGSPTAP
jgi:hypothetical protein